MRKTAIAQRVAALLVFFVCLTKVGAAQNPALPPTSPPSTPLGGIPIGTIMAFGGECSPENLAMLERSGWLPCDGRALRRLDSHGTPTPYADLFQVIGENFGEGYDRDIDPEKSGGSPGTKQGEFNLPDCRGRFLRGVDAGTGRDPDAASRSAMRQGGNIGDKVGSVQSDEMKSHSHRYRYGNATGRRHVYGNTDAQPVGSRPRDTGTTGGSETRPKNIYVNWIIKFR